MLLEYRARTGCTTSANQRCSVLTWYDGRRWFAADSGVVWVVGWKLGADRVAEHESGGADACRRVRRCPVRLQEAE